MQSEIDRFLQVLESERGFSVNTIFAYRNDLSQFLVYLHAMPDGSSGDGISSREIDEMAGMIAAVTCWEELTDGHLTSYLLYLRGRSYAASTVARKAAAIKSFCHFLMQEGHTRSDPAVKLASPKVSKYTPRSISHEEVARLLQQPAREDAAAASRPEVIRDRAMLETLYGSGMRVSELVALDIEDVNLDLGQMRAGAAGRDRIIPLPERATRAVSEYLDRSRPLLDLRSQAALFLNHRGRRLTRQGFWLILKSYAEAAGIADITPHTLRHTYAAHRLRDGAELGTVQRILGHVNISTTQVYQRLFSDGLGSPATGGAYVADDAGLAVAVTLGTNEDLERTPDGAADSRE